MITSAIGRVRVAAARARLAPVALRLGIVVSGVAAVLLADPNLGAVAILALLPALLPGTVAPGAFLVVTIGLWIIDTTGHSGSIGLVRVVALALAMYYVHAGAALAAVLPYDAVVTWPTITRWLARLGVVTVLTITMGVLAALLEGAVTHGSALAGTIGALIVAIATTIFLGRSARGQ